MLGTNPEVFVEEDVGLREGPYSLPATPRNLVHSVGVPRLRLQDNVHCDLVVLVVSDVVVELETSPRGWRV